MLKINYMLELDKNLSRLIGGFLSDNLKGLEI